MTERLVSTDTDTRPQTQPIVETARNPVKLAAKHDLFSKFWFGEALGRPIPSNNMKERRDYLATTYYGRIGELITELNVPILQMKDVATVSSDELRAYAAPFLATNATYLTDPEKKEVDRLLVELKDIDDRNLKPGDRVDFDGEKQRLYMSLVKAYLKNMPTTLFSDLPSQSAKHKSIDCSTATAIGMVIANEAGIEAEPVRVSDHVLMVFHTKNGTYYEFDSRDPQKKEVRFQEGAQFHGRKTFTKIEDNEGKLNPYNLFVRLAPEDLIGELLGSTTAKMNLSDEDLQKVLKNTSALQEDQETLARLKRDYPQNLFVNKRVELFDEASMEFLQSQEWREEMKAVQTSREAPVVSPVATDQPKDAKFTEPSPVEKKPEVNFIKRFFQWIGSQAQKIIGWFKK